MLPGKNSFEIQLAVTRPNMWNCQTGDKCQSTLERTKGRLRWWKVSAFFFLLSEYTVCRRDWTRNPWIDEGKMVEMHRWIEPARCLSWNRSRSSHASGTTKWETTAHRLSIDRWHLLAALIISIWTFNKQHQTYLAFTYWWHEKKQNRSLSFDHFSFLVHQRLKNPNDQTEIKNGFLNKYWWSDDFIHLFL